MSQWEEVEPDTDQPGVHVSTAHATETDGALIADTDVHHRTSPYTTAPAHGYQQVGTTNTPTGYPTGYPAGAATVPLPGDMARAVPSDDNPFGGIEHVDGLVYAPDTVSPELQWNPHQINVPPPPVRQRPTPTAPRAAEPWKPGPDPETTPPKTGTSAVKVLFVTVVPLMILIGLGLLVYRVMLAYGF